MTPFDIAKSYIGTTEGAGPTDNPKIMEMYASVGQAHVEHDEVAWCAAFVGHCLEQAGIRSTRRLNARSYLDWGVPVEVAETRRGDIGVIPRGSSSWQGHVFFIDRVEGAWVWGLGGNQDDAVTVKRYPVSKLLGVRRAGNVALAVTASVEAVQRRLNALGYHEVGQIDGAIGAAGSIGSQIAPALIEAEHARETAGRLFALLGLETWLVAALPWIGAAVFVGVIFCALRARAARIEDHRSGKTP